jgi:hypothetical protein
MAEKTVADRAAGLSEELLSSIESINQAALDAARKFVDAVEEALPAREEGSSKQRTILGAAVDLADQLVTKQHEFVRSVLRSAQEAAGGSGDEKK